MALEHYLVIGSEGFLGSYLVDALLERKCIIRCFDITQRKTWPACVEFMAGDLCNPSHIEQALNGITTVFLAASPMHDASRDVLFKVNVQGVETVLQACIRLNIPRLVYTGSAIGYFSRESVRNLSEAAKPKVELMPDYALSKHLGETMVLSANCASFSTCSLRLFALVGAGDRQISPPIFAAHRQGLSWAAVGNNKNLYDFTHIKDATQAHLLAADKLAAAPETVKGHAFFITGGTPVPFFNFVRKLIYHADQSESFNVHIPVPLAKLCAHVITPVRDALFPATCWSFTPFAIDNVASEVYFDISKARTLLGYRPTHSLDDAAKATAKAYVLAQNS
ncbi:erg26, C-3 sterol dehydrogenase [Entomophthora muscae]|uniref:Erg26, C-3 sterol dehydrogenase n=1 Tax=Entomophthora muscae TaxID=34485 RepID=A0ACC2RI69_9FUNG|nr:erg26, C-3 sterol dehydrogenase [Entomophthora muscae]